MFDLDNRAKPALKWAGGKSGILPQLLKHFPQTFKRYFEPFLGGGAVFFSLNPEKKAAINDSNKELITLYEVIRDAPIPLMKSLDKLAKGYGEVFYYRIRSSRPQDKVEVAARLVFLNKTCFNGLYRENSKGVFNVSFGKRVKCPALYEKENLLEGSRRLQKAEISCMDFEQVIVKANRGDLVYCDPPYEPLSATSSFQSYTSGRFPVAVQERLRDCCVEAANRGVTVIISNSTAPQIKTMYKGHEISTVMARRAINSKGDSRGEISELVIRVLPKSKSKRSDGEKFVQENAA